MSSRNDGSIHAVTCGNGLSEKEWKKLFFHHSVWWLYLFPLSIVRLPPTQAVDSHAARRQLLGTVDGGGVDSHGAVADHKSLTLLS